MPSPACFPSEPRTGSQKVAPTREQIANIVTPKLKSLVGQSGKAELPLKVGLPDWCSIG